MKKLQRTALVALLATGLSIGLVGGTAAQPALAAEGDVGISLGTGIDFGPVQVVTGTGVTFNAGADSPEEPEVPEVDAVE